MGVHPSTSLDSNDKVALRQVDLNIIRTRIGEACYKSKHDFLEEVLPLLVDRPCAMKSPQR